MIFYVISTITFSLIFYSDTKEILTPPKIVTQPPSDDIFIWPSNDNNSRAIYLQCEADGQPHPRYFWKKNDKYFHSEGHDYISMQPGQGTLIFAKFHSSDVGKYQCFAENILGVASSNALYVREAELKPFSDVLYISLEGTENEPFRFNCIPPYGNPKPKIAWAMKFTDGNIKFIHNSQRITVDTEGSLWFSILKKEDSTNYKPGNSFLLTVADANVTQYEPKLLFQSNNIVSLVGSDVELLCVFSGLPVPKISWFKNGQPIEYDPRIINEMLLTIHSVILDDEGLYSCEASNGIGETKSYTVRLTILAKPFFVQKPQSVNVADGENVYIKCIANGIPTPRIDWMYNGKPMEEALTSDRINIEPNSIEIKNILEDDIGNYGCNASNSLGYVYAEAQVNVLALRPHIFEATSDVTVVEGTSVSLTCNVYGVPQPLIKWFHDKKSIEHERFSTTYDSASKGYNLQIADVTMQDAGLYECRATNIYGEASASMELIIKEKTQITIGPEDLQKFPGSSAIFQCHAVSDLSLTMEKSWLYNGEPIDFKDGSRFIKSLDESFLSVTQLTDDDSGLYTCVVITELDEDQSSARLIVGSAETVTDASVNIYPAELNVDDEYNLPNFNENITTLVE